MSLKRKTICASVSQGLFEVALPRSAHTSQLLEYGARTVERSGWLDASDKEVTDMMKG